MTEQNKFKKEIESAMFPHRDVFKRIWPLITAECDEARRKKVEMFARFLEWSHIYKLNFKDQLKEFDNWFEKDHAEK